MMLPVRIMPSIVMDTIYAWLKMYTKHGVSLCMVEQKIKLELMVMCVTFWDDLWANILEHITMSPIRWQDIQAAWQSIKLSSE